ncbi:MAG: MmcQ/YjbR family DNA-binding protein [Bryobacteraceae bacterium]
MGQSEAGKGGGKSASSDGQLQRVRKVCLSLPGTTEKISHGEPTFFLKKGVYAMFSNNHHDDGHVAVWIPAAPGEREALIRARPKTFYRPPYVGVKGWVGIELDQIDDDELGAHLSEAWRFISKK